MDMEIKRRNPLLRKYGIAVAAAIILAAGVAWAISASRVSTGTASKDNIIIAEVTAGEFNDFIRLTGKVETGTVVQVSALETGIVEKKWVEEGEMVQPGDIILTLHNPHLRQQILDSESQLAEKQNMLRDTEIAMEKERLQVKQDMLAARVELNRKKRLAEQQRTLYDENLTSREEYLKACEDYELARENFDLLQNRLRQDSLYRGVQLAMMRESLHNMQENFALVRSRADNLNIRATHSGQLGSLTAELGQSIASGQQVGQINILDRYKLAVSVDEHYIDRVSPGLHGTARRGDHEFGVSVKKVYPEVSDGRFRADMVIDGDGPDNLRVGQTYPVDLTLSDPSEAVMVPRGQFFQSTGGKWIYVVEPDGRSARRREIRTGRQNPRNYEITEGLMAGERVIVSSYANFDEADKIIIK
ncbi:MAG: efflux transporter periplasmic adaptor subunit [Muribaculaceae bacterium]|nr:efflux transporter periplasmic adaptor subunit [Muribaculaceae bacterium]